MSLSFDVMRSDLFDPWSFECFYVVQRVAFVSRPHLFFPDVISCFLWYRDMAGDTRG